ncbi:MAG: D-alanine--D-alanine ligase [Tidjanibacter sp.]|nr:D-alanine--D-alanine ligase [Tidjanibacter sp.]
MNKIRVALLAGGDSSEREVALRSAKAVKEAFDRDKYDVTLIDVHGKQWCYVDSNGGRWPLNKDDFSLTVSGVRYEFDYAFIIIHGTPGENGMLQGYLDIMHVPYSTGGVVPMAVTFDKVTCKRVVASVGILQAKDVLLRRGDEVNADKIVEKLGLPLFVKPNASGSSCGVTKVKCVEELAKAVEVAFGESDAVLIEEFLAGREMACGVLITDKKRVLMPVTEIVPKNDFFDYEAKYTAGMSSEITPAQIPDELRDELQGLAEKAYRICGCKGLARVDFMVTDNGPYMIEINAIPGMGVGSIVPQQIEAMGMNMGEVLDLIVEDTI